MSHPEPDPDEREIDEEGIPVFIFHPDCRCPACEAEKALFDRWKVGAIARLGEHLSRARRTDDDLEIAYLSSQTKKALANWKPLKPPKVQ